MDYSSGLLKVKWKNGGESNFLYVTPADGSEPKLVGANSLKRDNPVLIMWNSVISEDIVSEARYHKLVKNISKDDFILAISDALANITEDSPCCSAVIDYVCKQCSPNGKIFENEFTYLDHIPKNARLNTFLGTMISCKFKTNHMIEACRKIFKDQKGYNLYEAGCFQLACIVNRQECKEVDYLRSRIRYADYNEVTCKLLPPSTGGKMGFTYDCHNKISATLGPNVWFHQLSVNNKSTSYSDTISHLKTDTGIPDGNNISLESNVLLYRSHPEMVLNLLNRRADRERTSFTDSEGVMSSVRETMWVILSVNIGNIDSIFSPMSCIKMWLDNIKRIDYKSLPLDTIFSIMVAARGIISYYESKEETWPILDVLTSMEEYVFSSCVTTDGVIDNNTLSLSGTAWCAMYMAYNKDGNVGVNPLSFDI